MIYVPEGKPVFRAMDSTVIQIEKLAERQRAARFSGYLVVSGHGSRGVLPFRNGEALPGTFEAASATESGGDALSRMRDLAAREGTVADLYAADPEFVALLSRYRLGNRLVAEIEAQLVDPAKLFALCAAKGLTGLVRVYLVRSRHRLGMQLLRGGLLTESQLAEAIRAQLTGDSGRTLLGHILVDRGFVQTEDVNRCLSEQVNEAQQPDDELGAALFVRGERMTAEVEARSLLSTPEALVDIFSLAPPEAA